MIKNIFIAAVLTLAFTMPVRAISIADFSSSQLKQVHHHEFGNFNGQSEGSVSVYLNTYSLEAIKYAPPQYSIHGTYYVVYNSSYEKEIREFDITADYDTRLSLATLLQTRNTSHPTPSMMAFIKAGQDTSGIRYTDRETAIYYFDGSPKELRYPQQNLDRQLTRHSSEKVTYDLINAMFIQLYQQGFDDTVAKEN